MRPAPDGLVAAKRRAELDYWRNLSQEISRDSSTAEQKRQALLQVCWDFASPRYRQALYLGEKDFEGLRILDLGCGPHCGTIGFSGCSKVGADPLMIEYLGLGYPLATHGVSYAQCTGELLPFRDAAFHAVLCVNALDHVDDLSATIREIARVLVPGGRFLGQLNFHPGGRPAEPVALTHNGALKLFFDSGLRLVKILDQGFVPEAGERRYYYELYRQPAAGPSPSRVHRSAGRNGS